MTEGTEIPVAGVHSMEHTADLAIEVTAESAAELFHRSALGMTYLLLERIPEDDAETRTLEVGAADLPGLLREWLRELLYWHESEGFSTASSDVRLEGLQEADADDGDQDAVRLEATVRGGIDRETPVREIKGVTLHGLAAEHRDDGWYGRVIFDV